jgi:hypothetical protein
MIPYESSSPIKSFSGSTSITLKEYTSSNVLIDGSARTISVTGYFKYIQNVNMNNVSSKYGYWEFTTGNSIYQDKLTFDVLQDENLKYQLPYKNYFFTHFDTGRYYKFSGIDSLSRPIYLTYDFSTGNAAWNNVPYLKSEYSSYITKNDAFFNLNIKKYLDPVITYNTIIEADKPSIDTFTIESSSIGSYSEEGIVKNEYSELIISRSGKLTSNSSYVRKTSVNENINQIVVGSSYSLNILNKRDRVFKIMSMSENYINEYNILATEYNLNKFKEIEDNYTVDNLNNTFNQSIGLTQYVSTNEDFKLKAPVIQSLLPVKYGNNPMSLEIKWGSVDNASSYSVFIQTPSKQTPNYETTIAASLFNNSLNAFVYLYQLPTNTEIGTYTVTIRATYSIVGSYDYKSSPISKRSVTILTY